MPSSTIEIDKEKMELVNEMVQKVKDFNDWLDEVMDMSPPVSPQKKDKRERRDRKRYQGKREIWGFKSDG